MTTNTINPTESKKITIIGLGAMGTSFVKAFIKSHHNVTIWNRTASKAAPLVSMGASQANTLQDALLTGNTIIISVSTYDDVYDILDPVKKYLNGKTLINLSSGTYNQAEDMSQWAETENIAYIDGAAMSGVRRVGQPDSLFLYSGNQKAFTMTKELLLSLGKAEFLGNDPGLTSLYDTALFGMAWGSLAGFYHAVALTSKKQIDAQKFASVASGHLPFLGSLMKDHAVHIDNKNYPNDDGSIDVHTAAMEHLVRSSHDHGISLDFPGFIKSLLDSGVSAGFGNDGIARVAEIMNKSKIETLK